MTTKFDALLCDKFFKNVVKKKPKWQVFWMRIIFIRIRKLYDDDNLYENLEKYFYDVVARYRFYPQNVNMVRVVIKALKEA